MPVELLRNGEKMYFLQRKGRAHLDVTHLRVFFLFRIYSFSSDTENRKVRKASKKPEYSAIVTPLPVSFTYQVPGIVLRISSKNHLKQAEKMMYDNVKMIRYVSAPNVLIF